MTFRDFLLRRSSQRDFGKNTFGVPAARVAWAAAGFLALEAALFAFGDRPLALYTKGLDTRSHELIEFFRSITDYAKGAWYLWPGAVAILVCGFVSRGREVPEAYRKLCGYLGVRALFIFGAVALSGIVVDLLKPIVGRARPKLLLSEGIYGFEPFIGFKSAWNSMPSGHSATAFAVAFCLIKLYPRATPLWAFFAFLLAGSRIMVDAHYLSDVLAGALLGWLIAEAFWNHGISPLAKVIFPIDNRFSKE
jgi:membrane-associated phospholipid phosphatase